MVKLAYGKFDAALPHSSDETWTRLKIMAACLKDGTPVPYEIAVWFGIAVESSNENPTRFIQSLGLKKGAGQGRSLPDITKAHWTGRLWELRRSVAPEAAIAQVQLEMEDAGNKQIPDRQTLQSWLSEAATGKRRLR